jgi:hypothetical protein
VVARVSADTTSSDDLKAAARALVEQSCAEQGVPVSPTDPAVCAALAQAFADSGADES